MLEEPAPDEEEAAMGGSNATWLIPLLVIAGIAAVVGSGNGGGANGGRDVGDKTRE